jgi:hypothetical protein
MTGLRVTSTCVFSPHNVFLAYNLTWHVSPRLAHMVAQTKLYCASISAPGSKETPYHRESTQYAKGATLDCLSALWKTVWYVASGIHPCLTESCLTFNICSSPHFRYGHSPCRNTRSIHHRSEHSRGGNWTPWEALKVLFQQVSFFGVFLTNSTLTVLCFSDRMCPCWIC